MVAEFEADLIRARTREGMQVAKAKGRLRGKQPKLSKSQEALVVSLYKEGNTPRLKSPTSSRSPEARSTAS
jgi:DNA invertase Pin-like site-specific DNA recombinase